MNYTKFTSVLTTVFLIFFCYNQSIAQISSFDNETKINYVYGEIGSASADDVNVKLGYTWSLYEIINTDFSFGLGLRLGMITEGYTSDSFNYRETSNIGFQPSIGYQFYTEKRIIEPQVNFDLSSVTGFGFGINTTFNRFLVGIHYLEYEYDEYLGIKIGYTFPKRVKSSF